MLEKNYKLAEMIFLEQVTGKKDVRGKGSAGKGPRHPQQYRESSKPLKDRYV